MPNMNGKVALITGASSGIGRATAEAFAASGAKVVAAARRADELATLVTDIEARSEGELPAHDHYCCRRRGTTGHANEIAGTSDSCKTISKTNEPNVATYGHKVQKGFTMLGLPTIRATIAATGQAGQIDARLWDISPGGTQRLITRGVYSLNDNQSGKITFQLHGNGYRFAAGDTVQLELLGRDAPYYQAGNFPVAVNVSNLTISLPTK